MFLLSSFMEYLIEHPTFFLLSRLHEFVWHGEDRSNIGRMIPGARKFKKLAAVPDQFSYNVSLGWGSGY